MYRYTVVKEELFQETIGGYTTYGIVAQEYREGSWYPVAMCSDVSTDSARAQALAARCNAVVLEPVHLPFVVQDFLEE